MITAGACVHVDACLQNFGRNCWRSKLGPGHDGLFVVHLKTKLCPLNGEEQYKDQKNWKMTYFPIISFY